MRAIHEIQEGMIAAAFSIALSIVIAVAIMVLL